MARAWWRTARAKFEILLISPIKPDGAGWNRPVLGDRVWGTYNTWTSLWRQSTLDLYALRHDQNRPGGYTGPGRFRTESFGFRWAAPLTARTRFTGEAIYQTGRIGNAPHRAYAYVGQFGYKTSLVSKLAGDRLGLN